MSDIIDKSDLVWEIAEVVDSEIEVFEEYQLGEDNLDNYRFNLRDVDTYHGHFENKSGRVIDISKFAKLMGYYDESALFCDLYEKLEVKIEVNGQYEPNTNRGKFSFNSSLIGDVEHEICDSTDLHAILSSFKREVIEEISDRCLGTIRMNGNRFSVTVNYDKFVQLYVTYDDMIKFLKAQIAHLDLVDDVEEKIKECLMNRY